MHLGHGQIGLKGAMQPDHDVASDLVGFYGVAIQHAGCVARQLLQHALHRQGVDASFVSGFHRHEQRLEMHVHFIHFRQVRLDLALELGGPVVSFRQPQLGVDFQIQVDVDPAVHFIGRHLVDQEVPAVGDGADFRHQVAGGGSCGVVWITTSAVGNKR